MQLLQRHFSCYWGYYDCRWLPVRGFFCMGMASIVLCYWSIKFSGANVSFRLSSSSILLLVRHWLSLVPCELGSGGDFTIDFWCTSIAWLVNSTEYRWFVALIALIFWSTCQSINNSRPGRVGQSTISIKSKARQLVTYRSFHTKREAD